MDARATTHHLGLVIFDCDGVLIDSEPLSLACLTTGLNRIGVAIDLATVRARFTGTSMPSIMAHIARDYGVTAPDGFVETVKAETLALFDTELQAMRGVAEAVAALGLPACVASSSDPVRLRHSLTLTGLLPLFGAHVFSSAQVKRGKPFPDLFLFAAERMGVPPGACLVVEDSVPGVTAARSAGMRVAGFTGGGHWGHDPAGSDLVRAGAARIFSDFSDLATIIAEA
ncbi:haloacid dehalogenase superfamily, subfamily IA, variant 3 with third motif having DD or ED [Methylobacterium phyllostachyos]|uniref:Haloacid dehalogenase superfamily, subfamily IA, variant 3 with third motif having DD or ED n=1 Tax=Methylobacterium phyllostachyos TaxID=582672 RepID=A0A1H0EAC4_9HYPH|nr:HAD family hydrolase [Methylobacterium phyllostachyos]SDN79258.1 haloacid dehalogenase superfamily, subfamily IA, variant 3 with third motif having DD or ED [Methylobacterium phyllostachyos]